MYGSCVTSRSANSRETSCPSVSGGVIHPASQNGSWFVPVIETDWTTAGPATAPIPAWQTNHHRVSFGRHDAYTTRPSPSHRPTTKSVRITDIYTAPFLVRPWYRCPRPGTIHARNAANSGCFRSIAEPSSGETATMRRRDGGCMEGETRFATNKFRYKQDEVLNCCAS